MRHIQFCIDEVLAEIDATLAADERVRALAQLDERIARGEVLVAVDGEQLRRHLQQQIEALPLVAARRKALELTALIGQSKPSVAEPTVAGQNAPTTAVKRVAAETPAADQEPAAPQAHVAPVTMTEAPPVIPVGSSIRRRPAWQKPMQERLAEAAAAGATVAAFTAGLWLTALPFPGDLFGSLDAALEPSLGWLDWVEKTLRAR